MTIYNLSNISSASNLFNLTTVVNTDIYGGVFAIMVLVGIFLIVYTKHSENNPIDAFTVASIIVGVIGTLGWYFSGIVNFYIMLVLNSLVFLAVILQFTVNRFN